MKYISIFSILLTSLLGLGQTSVPGGTVNGIWTLSGSPYQITNSIMIAANDSLIISPGVIVEFQGAFKLLVLGKLKAKGTVTDTITFKASNISAGWRGIRFDGTPSVSDTSFFKYCKLINGKANGSAPDDKGGAFYISGFSKVKIENSLINNCMATAQGGGIYINNASPLIIKNTISNNSTTSGGGAGVYLNNSNSLLLGNTISKNAAVGGNGGGGIISQGGTPKVFNNSISNNTAQGNGGAGLNLLFSNITFTGNVVSGNTMLSTNDGAGMLCLNGIVSITSNTFSGNSAFSVGGLGITQTSPSSTIIVANNLICYNNATTTTMANGGSSAGGGGIYVYGTNISIHHNYIINNRTTICGGGIFINNGDPDIHNNVICNNFGSIGGAVFSMYNCKAQLTNNTIANNDSNKGGAVYCHSTSTINIKNCIIYGNTAAIAGNQFYLTDEASDPNITYSDIEGGTAAFDLNGGFYTGNYANNINANPQFFFPTSGSGISFNALTANWSLPYVSPCVNSGDPTGSYPATDILGNARIMFGTIDMGALECIITSIKESDLNQHITVFPNPNNGKIFLNSEHYLENAEIIINSSIGSQMHQQNLESNLTSVDLSFLPKGIYFLSIYSNKQKIGTHKIILQ
ncbi:MAG: right-handed parallel beta-helix repeat-containing protein [Bacteroidia bacterium]|nr:right-handed parallel beta-helix repeat-containing protein [Bacteroidia bacterium]